MVTVNVTLARGMDARTPRRTGDSGLPDSGHPDSARSAAALAFQAVTDDGAGHRVVVELESPTSYAGEVVSVLVSIPDAEDDEVNVVELRALTPGVRFVGSRWVTLRGRAAERVQVIGAADGEAAVGVGVR